MQLNTTPSSSNCFLYLSSTIPEFKSSQHNTRSIAMSSSRFKKYKSQQEHLFLTLSQERSSAVLPPSLHLRPVPARCSCPVSRGLLRYPGWAPCRGKDTLGSKGEMKGTCTGCKQQKAPKMGQGHDWRGGSAPKWLKSGRAQNLQAAGLWGCKTDPGQQLP